jgi:type III restriction enzyme
VRETKGTTAADELRGTENQKIRCGERHFAGALGVDYKVVTSADELP